MGFLEKSFFINIKRLFKKTIEIKKYLKIKKNVYTINYSFV